MHKIKNAIQGKSLFITSTSGSRITNVFEEVEFLDEDGNTIVMYRPLYPEKPVGTVIKLREKI